MSNIKVNIATATLKLIEEGRIEPRRRLYFDIDSVSDYVGDKQLDSVLTGEDKHYCYACAVGALMCGAAVLFDDLTVNEAGKFKSMINYLKKHGFSPQEIAKIEYALEYSNEVADSSSPLNLFELKDMVLDSQTKCNIKKYIEEEAGFENGVFTRADIIVKHILTYIIEHEGNLPF